jgi:hypothetical protein
MNLMTDMTENMAENKTMTVSCICFIPNADHHVIFISFDYE